MRGAAMAGCGEYEAMESRTGCGRGQSEQREAEMSRLSKERTGRRLGARKKHKYLGCRS